VKKRIIMHDGWYASAAARTSATSTRRSKLHMSFFYHIDGIRKIDL
jgi:hypothetical protein